MLKLGIIGSGFWVDVMYFPGLVTYPEAKVVALAGNREESTKRLSEKWGVPDYYFGEDSYKEMIKRHKLDAVVIATPTHTHYKIAKYCLQNYIHVMCEKPLSNSSRECLELDSLAYMNGLVNLVGFTYSYLPEFNLIKKALEGTEYNNFTMQWICGFMHDVTEPRDKFNKLLGNRIFSDVGSHMIHMLNSWFGNMPAVLSTSLIPSRIPDSDGFVSSEIGGLTNLRYQTSGGSVIVNTDVKINSEYDMVHEFTFYGNPRIYYYNDWDKVRSLVINGEVLIDDNDPIGSYKDIMRNGDSMVRNFCNIILEKRTKYRNNFFDGAKTQMVFDLIYSKERK